MYAYVQDVAADWDVFEGASRALGDVAPDGMIMRVAGPTEAGFRVIEVWECREAWEAFRDSRLRPALRNLAGDAPESPPTFHDLVVRHAIFNSTTFGSVSPPL